MGYFEFFLRFLYSFILFWIIRIANYTMRSLVSTSNTGKEFSERISVSGFTVRNLVI